MARVETELWFTEYLITVSEYKMRLYFYFNLSNTKKKQKKHFSDAASRRKISLKSHTKFFEDIAPGIHLIIQMIFLPLFYGSMLSKSALTVKLSN